MPTRMIILCSLLVGSMLLADSTTVDSSRTDTLKESIDSLRVQQDHMKVRLLAIRSLLVGRAEAAETDSLPSVSVEETDTTAATDTLNPQRDSADGQ